MSESWFYYLHTNGDLIAKRFRPESDSTFVQRVWCLDLADRGAGFILLIEAAAMGARMNRVIELAKKWGMDGDDGFEFCERAGFVCTKTETEAGEGIEVHHKEDDETRTRGFGSTPLLALVSYVKAGDFADLASKEGYTP